MEQAKGKEISISNRKWGYAILMSKFVIDMWAGIPKSFGVLLPLMVDRFNTNYATLGFICSIPGTVALFLGPFASLVLKRVNHRAAAMSGGLIIGMCLVSCGFIYNIAAFGVLLALAGSQVFVYLPITILLNEYFKDNFVLVTTISSFGTTTGVMFLPIVAERSLEAYGYPGVFMMLGGIMLHMVAAAATIRKPIFKVKGNITDQDGSNLATSEAICHDRPLTAGRVDRLQPVGLQRATSFINGSRKDKNQALGEISCTIAKEHSNVLSDIRGISRGEDEELLLYDDDDEEHAALINNECYPTRKNETTNASKHDEDDCEDTFYSSLMSRCKLFMTKEILFLMCFPSVFSYVYSYDAWVLFLVPHAENLGINPSKAVFLSSIGGFGGIIGRTIAVFLLVKKFNMFKIYVMVGFLNSLTFLLDFIGGSFLIRSALAFIQGLCFFIQDTSGASFLKVLLKDENNFSFALGLIMVLHGCGRISSGVLTGALLDFTKSYTKVFMITGITNVCYTINIIVLLLILKRRVDT